MDNTISNRQMFFILLLTLTCNSAVFIAKEMTQVAGTAAWLIVLATSIVFAFVAAGTAALGAKFKGQTVLDYAPKLINKPVAYVIGIFYILLFMFILVFLITDMTKLLNTNFFLETPSWVLTSLGIILFCFIAYKGVTTLARLSEVIGVFFIFTAVFIHILMAIEGNFDEIRPFFNIADIEIPGAFRNSIFPFLGIEVLLIFPFSKNVKKTARKAFFSVIFIGLFYILIIESCIMKIGLNHILNHEDALIIAIRDTTPRMLEVIARMDVFYLTVGFWGLFIGISIVMLAVVEFVCRIFKNANRLFVVIIIGVLSFVLSVVTAFFEGYEDFSHSLGTILGLFGTVVLPLGLLLIAALKGRKNKEYYHAD